MFESAMRSACGGQSRLIMLATAATAGLVVLFPTESVGPGGVVYCAQPQGAADDDETGAIPNPNRPTKKQLKAYAGLVAVAGIMIVGVALATMIVLWAGWLRRQLRRPLPDADLPERDFWFLKPPKPTVANSALPDAHQPLHDQPPTDPQQDALG